MSQSSVDPQHTLRYIITPTLKKLELYSDASALFLLGIAITETGISKLETEFEGAGIFNISQEAHNQVVGWLHSSRHGQHYHSTLKALTGRYPASYAVMRGNHNYAAAICRLYLEMSKINLSDKMTVHEMGRIWANQYSPSLKARTMGDFRKSARAILLKLS